MLDEAEVTRLISDAMRAQDAAILSTLRLLKVALQNEKIALGHILSDDEAQTVLRRELKKREESISAFTQAGRAEMAQGEEAEAALLRSYLPAQLNSEQIRAAAKTLIEEKGGSLQPGPLIGMLMQQLKGRADGNEVSRIVRELLG